VSNIRKISDYENGCLNLIEQRLEDIVSSFVLIRSENIYDEDEDIVYRSFKFNRGIEEWVFCISPNKEIKFFEYGVPQELVDDVLESLN
tara:strand:- start:717 stop:983 length:267 start_codon:yes stop_codon:yes gene_type:complete